MPIESPDLGDLRYTRTVEELIRRIPVYSPEWTDHNDSDPGITLIQLFAYLAEQVGYRLNRIPEKNHVELLKLLGTRLRPVLAARSRLALLLDDPRTLVSYTLPAGARARAKLGNPPPSFETDVDIDVVPAQMGVLIATKNPFLWDVLRPVAGLPDALPSPPPDVPNDDTPWLTVAWDGRTPPLKTMPLEPVRLRPRPDPEQPYLWIGLRLNAARDAGFRGVRVTMTFQLDDDEQPSLTAQELCAAPSPRGEEAPVIDWLWYFDADADDVRKVPGRIEDTTERFTRSGSVRFTVPFTLGPIPATLWANLRYPPELTSLEACLNLGQTLQANLPATGPLTADQLGGALTKTIATTRNQAAAIQPPIAHPLDPQLRAPDKVDGWLRIELAAPAAGQPPAKLRMLTFNAVPVTNATTVVSELLGVADGRPGQEYRLAHRNVLDGTLLLAVREASDETTPLVSWTAVESLDPAGPFERVFALDREAGVVLFGDGRRGLIPPLVPRGGEVVALRYRYGGGKAGEVGVAAIATLETAARGVSEVVNVAAASGGRDAETLDEAKVRARKELSTRSRAVTAGDFEWIALRTPGVRVTRAAVVPLRRPLPAGQAGLDAAEAPGAVSVVVVPDLAGPEPIPTPSFLTAVCRQLNDHRLVTTEVHVVPPQYLRLSEFVIEVKARPGYSRVRLQELVEQRLSGYLHVLTGGEDGRGFPFGGQVHIADLMAQVFRTEGVDRVERVSARFTRTKSNASPQQGALVLCPNATGQYTHVPLAPEENVSLDSSTFTLRTVA